MRRPLFAAVALALLLLVGCQRLNYEKTFTLDAPYWTASFDAPRGDQKVTVTATSTEEPINVFLILTEDTKEGERAAESQIKPEKALGARENSKEISFEATVPAKKEFTVFISLAKGARRKTDIKLSVKSH